MTLLNPSTNPGTFESTNRFLRPSDPSRTRRNQRQIQVQKLFIIAANVLLIAAVVLAIGWTFRWVRSNERFAVRTVEIAGATHTPRAELDAITKQYAGLNLFKVDVARVRHDLGGLSWIREVAIEQKLPGTLRIRVIERKPAAIVLAGGILRYVDDRGVAFADVTPRVGDDDLPLISADDPADIARCITLLTSLRLNDPALYGRVSEIKPAPPKGFAIFDRTLGAFVYAGAESVSARWRELDGIVAAEHFGRGDVEYADLRFDGRVIVKPVRPITNNEGPHLSAVSQITN
jgi:cell division septal protein FtsQ